MNARTLLTTVLAVGALSIPAGTVPAHSKTTLKVSTCLQRTHDYIDAYFETFVKPINAMKGDVSIRYLGGNLVLAAFDRMDRLQHRGRAVDPLTKALVRFVPEGYKSK